MVNFRKHTLTSGLDIYAGKNAENNDELIRTARKTDILLHTETPGSPFVNIGSDATNEEIGEATIFCAKHSQEWRDNKRDVAVNVFKRNNMKKGIFMKKGTWNVKKYFDTIKVKKIDIIKFEKNMS